MRTESAQVFVTSDNRRFLDPQEAFDVELQLKFSNLLDTDMSICHSDNSAEEIADFLWRRRKEISEIYTWAEQFKMEHNL